MIIDDPIYEIGTPINAAWDENDIRSKGKVTARRYDNGWKYRIVFDDINYTKYQEYWYYEHELAKGFVTKW